MYKIPRITPIANLISATEFLKYISTHRLNYYSTDKRYPYGESDSLTYFFISRKIKIVDNPIVKGAFNPPDYNRESLSYYINYCVNKEVELIDYMINKLEDYGNKQSPISSPYLSFEPDFFLIFFAERDLPIRIYSAEFKRRAGDFETYKEDIEILNDYKKKVNSFLILHYLYKKKDNP